MSVSGRILVALDGVPRDHLRHRADDLRQAPDGARVVLIVGALAVEPEAVRVLLEHVDRLHIDVWGERYAMDQWVDALAPFGVTV